MSVKFIFKPKLNEIEIELCYSFIRKKKKRWGVG